MQFIHYLRHLLAQAIIDVSINLCDIIPAHGVTTKQVKLSTTQKLKMLKILFIISRIFEITNRKTQVIISTKTKVRKRKEILQSLKQK